MNIFGFGKKEVEEGVSPEMVILKRMISYFEPLPMGLLEHLDSDDWCGALIILRRSFNEDNPRLPFSL